MKTRSGLVIIGALALSMIAESAFAQWDTQWQLGAPGRGWPVDGVGGGPDVDFVQEAGVNPPPGDPNSLPVNQQADDDYYFAGVYPDPPIGVGIVLNDEIAMERAFAGIDNDLRIHFNLPPDRLNPSSLFRFSFEAYNLDERVENPNPRYGVELFFNDVPIMPEMIITPGELGTVFTTAELSFENVDAVFGPGGDNVVSLRGINYNAEGGGNWMGMDYHTLEVNPIPEPSVAGILVCGGIFSLAALLRLRKSSR